MDTPALIAGVIVDWKRLLGAKIGKDISDYGTSTEKRGTHGSFVGISALFYL